VELRDEYLDIAKQKAKSMGITNVEFKLSRAEDVLLEGPFDCITASYLAKYADLITLTRKTKKMLREGGVFLMHDFTYPSNRVCAWIWGLYFSLLQRVGTLWYPQWSIIYYELPELIRKTNWVTELVELLKKEGFSEITTDALTFETSALVMARK
jgi:demethylmenaquinone methyltransferase/2-methoxy-6-polyprenyl-1,4-benzoquinol methylase